MEVLEARVSRKRPEMGVVTLQATMHRGETLVMRSRFTGMFGLRGA
jgi:hypothetical protein